MVSAAEVNVSPFVLPMARGRPSIKLKKDFPQHSLNTSANRGFVNSSKTNFSEPHADMKTFEKLVLETSYSVRQRLKPPGHEVFENCMDKVLPEPDGGIFGAAPKSKSGRDLNDLLREVGQRSLFVIGLCRIFSKQVQDFQARLYTFIRHCVPSRSAPEIDPARSQSRKISTEIFDKTKLQFVCATSGSGKTTSTMDKLRHEYGHYVVPAALRSASVGRNIMDPKLHAGVSKDTHDLIKLLERVKQLRQYRRVGWSMTWLEDLTSYWWGDLWEARERIYRIFRAAKDSDSSRDYGSRSNSNLRDGTHFLNYFRSCLCSTHITPKTIFLILTLRLIWDGQTR